MTDQSFVDLGTVANICNLSKEDKPGGVSGQPGLCPKLQPYLDYMIRYLLKKPGTTDVVWCYNMS